MAETATAKPATARPSRARSTTAKTAPAKSTPAKEAPAALAEDNRIKVEFEYHSETANYVRFNAPENLKGVVVGSVYAPRGTTRVLVAVIGNEETSE